MARVGQGRSTLSFESGIARLCRLFGCAVLALGQFATSACEALAIGNPPTSRVVLPLRPDAASYDLEQDSLGLLYVASDAEVLVYDGSRWERIAIPGSLVTRSLKRGPDGRIYVGGFDRLGVIMRDRFGALVYQDWTGRIPAEKREGFEDVWDVRSDAQSVYFRTLRELFRFSHDGRLTGSWTNPKRFGGVAFINGELWIQWRGEGLKRLVGNDFEMLPGGELFADTQIYHLWPHPDGGQVVVSQRAQLQWLRDGKLSAIDWLPEQVPPTSLSAHATLPSGAGVSGVQDGRLLHLDFHARRATVSSASNDYISGLVVGARGNLWTVDDEVLTHVQIGSPWRVLDAADGVRGTQADLREIAGDWYGLSSAGVYVARAVAQGNPQFKRLDLPIAEAWSIAADGADLLIAESYALWQLRPGLAARPISDKRLYPTILLPAQSPARRFYIGTSDGFAVADLSSADAAVVRQADLGAALDTLVEIEPGRVLAASQSKGVFELTIAPDGNFQARPLTAASGLKVGEDGQTKVFRLAQSVYVSTRAGLFRWDGKGFVRDTLDGLSALLPASAIPAVVESTDGSRWALSEGRAFRYDAKRWSELYPPIGDGPLLRSLHMLGEKQVVFGATSRLLLYDPAFPATTTPELPTVVVRHAWLEGASERRFLPLDGTDLGVLPPRSTLRVQFAAPALAGEAVAMFRQRVIGIDQRWSEWSPVAEVSLAALPTGRMRLQIQARSGDGEPGAVRSLSWEIMPIWHERTDVRLLLIGMLLVLGGLGVGAASRWRLKRLRARNDRLEEIVHSRTEALELANVQLRAQTLRDGLTGIANRRAFDNALREAWHRALVERSSLALLMIDADRFKEYNDRHGHLQGDQLLRNLATELAREDSADRLSARWGGEEFAVLLAAADSTQAAREAERVRARINALDFGVSVSVGVAATVPTPGAGVESLMAAADGALYAAKAAGRNQVVVA